MEMKIRLMEDSFTEKEFKAVLSCLRGGQYTQGNIVEEFETKFARWNGSEYGVMVNSGSSANLLMVFMLKQKFGLNDGDEVIVPAVTWPTTIYPIIQNNLTPVFCDVDDSFNLDVNSIKRMISNKTKAIFLVHLLGQPANLGEIMQLCKEHNLILIEDCCESMGAKFKGVKVGNFGEMGSFSLYFGHHMTTIEGGLIVTDNLELYDLLKSARSHGWVRGSNRQEVYSQWENKDFLFDMLGYNFRSTNVNAAIGLVQLEKLEEFINIRLENHNYFLKRISGFGWKHQKVDFNETSSFSLALLFSNKSERNFVLQNLILSGIESRPIVAGNLLKQPVFNNKNIKADKTVFADVINDCGIYLPNNQFMNVEKVDYMVDTIKSILNDYLFKIKLF